MPYTLFPFSKAHDDVIHDDVTMFLRGNKLHADIIIIVNNGVSYLR